MFPPSAARLTCATAALLALIGCTAPQASPPADPVAGPGGGATSDAARTAACRQRAEEIFRQQNRASMSRSDPASSPFSGGMPIQNNDVLADRFQLQKMIDECVRSSSGPAAPASPVLPPQ